MLEGAVLRAGAVGALASAGWDFSTATESSLEVGDLLMTKHIWGDLDLDFGQSPFAQSLQRIPDGVLGYGAYDPPATLCQATLGQERGGPPDDFRI